MTKAATPTPKTRILIECGYHKIMLPAGTSADEIAILANATAISHQYVNGKTVWYPNGDTDVVSINIVNEKSITNFIDARGEDHPEYDIIIENVKERLNNSENHGSIIFDNNTITSGSEKFEYVDLSDPEVDPEEIINAIVNAALGSPVGM